MVSIRKTITAERVRELFDYNPQTGVVTRADTRKKVGTPNVRGGYLVIRVDDKLYYLHRLIWLWMTGEMPRGEIDHRNHNSTDNRFSNLRLATHAQNQQNRPKHNKNNRNGFKGVSYSAAIKARPWRATISANGKFLHLGRFATKAEAFAAYQNAARQRHREFAGV